MVEEGGFEVIDQPLVVNPYANPSTSKSANAGEKSLAARFSSVVSGVADLVTEKIDKVADGITDSLFKVEDAQKENLSDPEEDDAERPTR